MFIYSKTIFKLIRLLLEEENYFTYEVATNINLKIEDLINYIEKNK